MINLLDLHFLYPNVVRVATNSDGDITENNICCYDENGEIVNIDFYKVNAYSESQEYQQLRAAEYPSIQEQLDDLFHQKVFSEQMLTRIENVKKKYPKLK